MASCEPRDKPTMEPLPPVGIATPWQRYDADVMAPVPFFVVPPAKFQMA